MKSFGKYLNDITLSNEKDFQNLYVQVSKKLFPEQEKTPVDFQKRLSDGEWLKQRDQETFDELLDRISECFENAYPNEHKSDVNRFNLATKFYCALSDRYYKEDSDS